MPLQNLIQKRPGQADPGTHRGHCLAHDSQGFAKFNVNGGSVILAIVPKNTVVAVSKKKPISIKDFAPILFFKIELKGANKI